MLEIVFDGLREAAFIPCAAHPATAAHQAVKDFLSGQFVAVVARREAVSEVLAKANESEQVSVEQSSADSVSDEVLLSDLTKVSRLACSAACRLASISPILAIPSLGHRR